MKKPKLREPNSPADDTDQPKAPATAAPLKIEKEATATLMGTDDHYAVFRFNDGGGRTVRVAIPMSATRKPRVVLARLLDKGLPWGSEAQQVRAISRAISLPAVWSGVLIPRNGWMPGGCDSFILGDRVLRPSSASRQSTDTLDRHVAAPLAYACIAFDARAKANRVGLYSLPPQSEWSRKKAGTVRGWKKSVCRIASYSSVSILAICAALAAPLLAGSGADPFIVLLTGRSSRGKTSATLAAASMLGIANRLELPTWEASVPGLEGLSRNYTDQMLPMDDLKTAKSSGLSDFNIITRLAHFFSHGASRKKHGPTVAAISGLPASAHGARTIVVTSFESSLQRVASEAGRNFDEGVMVRCIEIPIPTGPTGVFDDKRLTGKGARASKKLVAKLDAACATYHGAAFREWLKMIMNDGHIDEYLRTARREFLKQLPFDRDSGVENRHADCFTILFAAGVLASKKGLVPWTKKRIEQAILKCHRRSLDALRARALNRTLFSQLVAKLCDPEMFPRHEDARGTAEILGSTAVVRGKVVHRVSGEALRRWFPNKGDRDALTTLLVDRGYLKPKGNKLTKQVRIRGLKRRIRCYELLIPEQVTA